MILLPPSLMICFTIRLMLSAKASVGTWISTQNLLELPTVSDDTLSQRSLSAPPIPAYEVVRHHVVHISIVSCTERLSVLASLALCECQTLHSGETTCLPGERPSIG